MRFSASTSTVSLPTFRYTSSSISSCSSDSGFIPLSRSSPSPATNARSRSSFALSPSSNPPSRPDYDHSRQTRPPVNFPSLPAGCPEGESLQAGAGLSGDYSFSMLNITSFKKN